jgi:hypothetical protein
MQIPVWKGGVCVCVCVCVCVTPMRVKTGFSHASYLRSEFELFRKDLYHQKTFHHITSTPRACKPPRNTHILVRAGKSEVVGPTGMSAANSLIPATCKNVRTGVRWFLTFSSLFFQESMLKSVVILDTLLYLRKLFLTFAVFLRPISPVCRKHLQM